MPRRIPSKEKGLASPAAEVVERGTDVYEVALVGIVVADVGVYVDGEVYADPLRPSVCVTRAGNEVSESDSTASVSYPSVLKFLSSSSEKEFFASSLNDIG